MKQKIFFFSFLLLSTCNFLFAQDALPSFIKDSLDTYLQSEQKQWKIPALAVAIIKDDKVVKTYVEGVTDYESNTPIDEHTLFMIGSNSKAFTSTLMATLEQEKVLSLKDPVVKWLPYFKLQDPWLTQKVDIVDVLSHRVGFETFQGDFLNFDNELTSEEIIKKFALITPTHQYRETWGYFNTGYTIAGEIVKSATGKTWAEQLQEKFFTPLEMKNSLALSKDMLLASNRTLAHTLIKGEPVVIDYGDIDATAPAGSISSSISDMSKWVTALLADGKYQGEQVIPVKAIEATRTPRSIMGNARNPFSLYGLGWDIQEYDGHKLIMHTGGIHGYVTSVTMLPEKNLGIVILTNTDSNYLFEGLKYDILNAYLDNPHRGISSRYYVFYERGEAQKQQQKEAWVSEIEKGHKPSVALSKFEGTYRNEVYGWIKINKVKDELHIDFEHHKSLKVTLKHTKDNEFLASFSNVLYGESIFPFEVVDGKVKKFTLKLDPQVEQTTYDFYKE